MKSIRILSFALVALLFSCDPQVTLDEVIENQSSDAIILVRRINEASADTLTIQPAGDLLVALNSVHTNSVRSLYEMSGDSVTNAIVDIRKQNIICKRNWRVKSNWAYKEFDEEHGEIRLVVTDSDF